MSFAAEGVVREGATAGPSAARHGERPAEPGVTLIERRTGWSALNLAELWRYRELLFQLTWRDVQVRYKQTVLGVAWAVLQPLATMAVFSLFFRRLGGPTPEGVPYALFVLAGLLPWYFFANAISSAGQSVIGNQSLVTKVYFPRLFIPLSAVGANLADFAIGFVLLLAVLVVRGTPPGLALLLAPLAGGGLVVAATGVGMLLSALTVAYRDFRYVVPFLTQLWMFATPAVYMPAEALAGEPWAPWLALNPAHGLIAGFRAAALGGPFDGPALAVSSASAALLLGLGCLYFRRVERSFADII